MLSDSHSIEYSFTELQPEVCGVRLDILISGTAVLVNDPGYTFAVESITLDGSVKDQLAKPGYFTGRPWKTATLTIKRLARYDRSTEAVLFRLIEAALYQDRDAINAWNSEIEDASA